MRYINLRLTYLLTYASGGGLLVASIKAPHLFDFVVDLLYGLLYNTSKQLNLGFDFCGQVHNNL